MTPDDERLIVAFETPKQLGAWLRKNHDSCDELWVKIHKKATGLPSVSWNDIVLETLCWGWIDGMKKSLDETSYLQRITPRRPRSLWSKRNTEHVEKLIAANRMQPPGLAEVEAAKADGRWENAYKPSSEVEVPQDFIDAVAKEPAVAKFYETLTKSSRHAISFGLITAKRPETRVRRFDKFLQMLRDGEKPGFGFKAKPKD